MEHIVNLNGAVTGFYFTEQFIDCMCGKEILKIEKGSGKVICNKEIFKKEGFSRKLIADNRQIIIFDFCTLYILNRENYELVGKWQLGSDLSSDLVGIAADENTVYCSIRNGNIITLDRQSYEIKEYYISDSSMWSIKTYDTHLVCGTVDGRLLLLDKVTLSIEKTLILGKKNIRSFYIDGEILYAASQDGKLFKVDLTTFEIDTSRKNTHKKMFDCVGIYEDMVITVSYPCSEVSFWDKDTLEKRKTVNVPLKLLGRAHIENDFLYIASRNILGIDRIRLNELK